MVRAPRIRIIRIDVYKRQEHGRALPGWDAIRDFDPKNPPIKELEKYIAVSYTHLDVYKRQA